MMQYGREAHDVENVLERERSLQRYGLHTGERRFNVRLFSETLQLNGIADLIVYSDGNAYPIEFKHTTGEPTLGHQMQLCAYGLLIEHLQGTPSPRGYWHSTRTKETLEIDFKPALRRRTQRAIQEINDFIRFERCPPPTSHPGKCLECELLNFCGDTRP
jgi:CRISPR-associated exonuclease Cas4